MWEVIQDVFQGCTVIAVAHRLASIMDFDRVVVLHEGRRVECDEPRSLLQRPDSIFAQIWASGGAAF